MIEGRAFLEFARSLTHDESEVSRRSQVSRAYYAAFLEARQYGQDAGLHTPTRRPQEHADIANALGGIDRQLKFDIASLRSMRNGADYDMHISADTIARQADEAIRLASSIIERLDAVVADANHPDDEVDEPLPTSDP
jgi:uncharacterized protein (UPF0332 family)